MKEYTLTPETKCPNCNVPINAASSREGRIPSEGDFSICMHCQTILIFNEDLTLREMDYEEWNELPDEVQIHLTFERIKLKMLMLQSKARLN